MGQIKVGVIGAGGIRGKGWALRVNSYSKKNKNLILAALCDVNELTLKRIASLCGKVATYTDYLEMYEKEQLDAVVIVTPHYLHAKMAVDAANRGIHVFTEKPMCINLKQADDMIAASEKNGIVFAVGHQYRLQPHSQALKKIADSGDLGFIYQINTFIRWYRSEPYYLNSTPVKENEDEDWEGWRGHWKTEGAGALSNQTIHHIDIFGWIASKPIKSVRAVGRIARHTLVETDDNTNVIVEFEDGSIGNMILGVAYKHGKDDEFGLYGTKGAIVYRKSLTGLFGKTKKRFLDYRPKVLQTAKPLWRYMLKLGNPTKRIFMNFVKAIETGDKNLVDVGAREGKKSIELMRAILLSAKSGQTITFPFEDDPAQFPDLQRTYSDPKYADLV